MYSTATFTELWGEPIIQNQRSSSSQNYRSSLPEYTGISVSSLTKGDRIRIPLNGEGQINGNLRLVLRPERRTVEIHVSYGIKPVNTKSGEVIGLDAGITEVYADDAGNMYGPEMGNILKEASVKRKEKGESRNRLHSLEKKYRKQGKRAKARNIRRNNLGRKTLKRRTGKVKATISSVINRSINEVIEKRKPGVIVIEKLDIRGPAQSKEISRRVSMWHRSTLTERIDFKASVAGCDREQVNAAYTSQVCPLCGYLNKANRKGDRFQCLICGYGGQADMIASQNLKARYYDREITLYTPKEFVRKILVGRYEARKEHRNAS